MKNRRPETIAVTIYCMNEALSQGPEDFRPTICPSIVHKWLPSRALCWFVENRFTGSKPAEVMVEIVRFMQPRESRLANSRWYGFQHELSCVVNCVHAHLDTILMDSDLIAHPSAWPPPAAALVPPTSSSSDWAAHRFSSLSTPCLVELAENFQLLLLQPSDSPPPSCQPLRTNFCPHLVKPAEVLDLCLHHLH